MFLYTKCYKKKSEMFLYTKYYKIKSEMFLYTKCYKNKVRDIFNIQNVIK